MFRRSRFSVRPNVGTGGRAASATPQETPAANQEASETPKEAVENISATAVTNKPDAASLASGDGNDQNGDGASSSTALQRRKRFSVKPKVAPGRPPALSRTPKSPVKAASATHVGPSVSDFDQPSTSSQTDAAAPPQGLQSPRHRRQSEDSNQQKIPPKPTPAPSENSGLSAVESPEQTSSKRTENTPGQDKKASLKPDKVPPSLPDKEATEISEKAKTLVSSKSVVSLKPSELSLTRLLNTPSDLQRLVKAQKLRELLKQERWKEKRLKRAKSRQKEFTLDPAKMTMRDLIYYLPTSNPMTSSLEDSAQEEETDVPPSPGRQGSPERAQQPKILPDKVIPREEEQDAAAAVVEGGDEEEEEEEALMVPQVKVAEDGSLIIDEESLTVEVQRAKGPNPAEEREPIFERGSTTTYSSFRKGIYTKPWSIEETDMFYLAVSMVGTDFSMICQLFPHRARSEIKNKFKKEERENSWRIDKAFRERRKLDIEYFSKLLEKVLEVQKDRKKLKSLVEKNNTKKSKARPKGRKYTKKLSDVEEEDENEAPELEEGGEKENEDQSNEGSISASEPKKKRKRQTKPGDLDEGPNDKKNKTDEAGVPEDSEAALPEDQTNSDMSEKKESATTAKDTAIKPAKLSRGRAPTPLVPLGLKRGKKPSANARETASDKADESVKDGASEEQKNTDESHLSQSKKKKKKSGSDEVSSSSSSEDVDDVPVKPQRPTRYGRVPKPPQPLNYPSKDEAHSSASEATPASPSTSKSKPKATIKRGKTSKQQPAEKSKKPKLITLRSSRTEFSGDESDDQWEGEEGGQLGCSSSTDRDAPLFVPDSLHTTNPEISEVDESMVELDILASMPDVLGISQDALCPDSSCHQAQHETGTAEPCEHQLDLLVDVIDFLSSEHADVSHDDSYNEAAQALLTIGNLPLSAHGEVTVVDWTTEATPALGNQPSRPEEDAVTPSASGGFGCGVTDASDVTPAVELEGTEVVGAPHINTSHETVGELQTVGAVDPALPSQSDKNFPARQTGRSSMVKPKPNLGRTSGTPPPESHTEEAEGSPNIPRVDEAPSAAEETTSRTPESTPALLTDSIPPTEVKRAEEPSDNKKAEDKSDAPTSELNPSVIQSCSFTESQFEPSREQSARKTTHESTDEAVMSGVGRAETLTSEAAVTDAQQAPCSAPGPVKEAGEKAPTCVSSAEHSNASQKGDAEAASLSQSRRSRLPKVKPKPNLPQTSRAARCKPQTTKEAVDKDSLPSTSKQTAAEVEPTRPPSPSPGLTEKPPAGEDMKTHVDQLVSAAASSDQQAGPSREQTTRETGSTSAITQENLVSDVGTTQSGCKHQTATDLKATEEQDGRGFSVESEGKTDPALTATSVGQVTVSQEQGKAAGTSQLRRSRLQKPKPNLAPTSRAARSKPQTSEKSAEKDLNLSANPEFLRNIIAEVEPQPVCTPAPEKLSESTDPASGLGATSPQSAIEDQNISEVQLEPGRKRSSSEPELSDEKLTSDSRAAGVKEAPPVQERDPGPAQNRDSAKTPTADVEPQSQDTLLLEKQEESANVALVRKENLGAFAPDPGSSETQSFSKVQSEPDGEQTSGETEETSVFTDENVTSHPGETEVRLNDVTGDSGGTESHLEQPSNVDSAPVQDQAGPPSARDPTAGELLDGKEAIKVASRCQPRRSRPKPDLQQASRTVIFKPQTTKQPAEDQSPSLEPELDKKTIAEVKPHSENVALSETQSKSTDVGLVNKEDITAVRPDLVASENPTTSEVQPESSQERIPEKTGKTSKLSDENLTSNLGTTESLNKVVTAGSLNTDSTPVQDQSGHLVTPDVSVDRSPVSTEETEVPPCQPRRSRLQKPKPNLQQASRTARFKTQTTKQPAEEDQSPGLEPELDSRRAAEADPQSRDISFPETRSESVNVGLVNKEDVIAVRSDPVASEIQSVSEVLPVQDQSGHPATPDAPADKPSVSKEETEVTSRCKPKRSRLQKPKPNLQRASRSTRFKPQTTKEPAEADQSPRLKPESDKNIEAVMQSQLPDTSSFEKQSESKADGSEGPTIALQVVDKPPSPASRPESSDNAVMEPEEPSACCTSPPEGAGSVSVSAPLPDLASSHAYSQEPSAAEQQLRADVQQASSSEVGEQDEPGGRQRPSKVKPSPNLQSSCEKLELVSSGEASDINTSFTVTSEQTYVDPTVEMESAGDEVSNKDQVETNSTSLGDCKMGQSTRQMTDPTESRTSPACSEGESSVQGADRTPSELTDSRKATRKAAQTRRGRLIKPKPNLRCSTRLPTPQQVDSVPAEAESGGDSQDSKATSDHKPEPEPKPGSPESALGKSSTPNDAPSALDFVSQVLSTQNPSTSSAEGIQNFPLLLDMLPEQVPSDPDEPFFILSLTEIPVFSAEEGVEPLPYLPAMDPPVPVTDLPVPVTDLPVPVTDLPVPVTDLPVPVTDLPVPVTDLPVPVTDLPVPVTDLPVPVTDLPVPVTDLPVPVTDLPVPVTDLPVPVTDLPVPVTDLPVPVTDLPVPVTDVPAQQPSVPGESLVAEADGSTSNAPPPVSAEESDVVDLTSAEPAVASSHQLGDPVDPQGSEGTPETVDRNRPETSTSGPKRAGTGRRAKVKARPSTKREKRCASMATETESPSTSAARDSDQPEPRVQPKASDDPVTEPRGGSGGRPEVETEARTGGKEADDIARLQTGQGRGCRKRKAKDFPSFLSETSESGPRPARAASKRSKVKAPSTEAKPPSSEPAAPTSRDVTPAQTPTRPAEVRSGSASSAAQSGGTSDHSPSWSALASGTSHCSTAEEGDVAESCSAEEEPTNVSQFFFSDIFTEVEEG